MQPQHRTFIIGDVHGQHDKTVSLLREADLIDKRLAWSGGDAHLWFMGDFFDRGPEGLAAVDLVMHLQGEAARDGGSVQSLIGNHEMLIMSAQRFGDRPTAWGGNFIGDWLMNGGQESDLIHLTPVHVEWLSNLPAMALLGDTLLMHADAGFYLEYGKSVNGVNAAFRSILLSDDAAAWDLLLGRFGQRLAFMDPESGGDDPAARVFAAELLKKYGGRKLVHGHTPIGSITGKPHSDVIEPLVYQGGMCVNVDGGMYKGGPGFVYELHPVVAAQRGRGSLRNALSRSR
jgi:hypothetical protein